MGGPGSGPRPGQGRGGSMSRMNIRKGQSTSRMEKIYKSKSGKITAKASVKRSYSKSLPRLKTVRLSRSRK